MMKSEAELKAKRIEGPTKSDNLKKEILIVNFDCPVQKKGRRIDHPTSKMSKKSKFISQSMPSPI
jgi:hypothetical protein